jgi:hypothetical protein
MTATMITSPELIAVSLPVYGILFAMILIGIFVLTRIIHLQK